jgi:hypothetical protein
MTSSATSPSAHAPADVDFLGLRLDANPASPPRSPGWRWKETRLFIDEVTWQSAGRLPGVADLTGFLPERPLASFYGVPGVTGAGFTSELGSHASRWTVDASRAC